MQERQSDSELYDAFAETHERLTKGNPEIRTFFVAAIAIALTVFNIGFNLGVYGEVFFEHFFAIWVAASAVLIADFFIHDDHSPLKLRGKILMGLPTIGIVLTVALISIDNDPIFDDIVELLAAFIALVTLPYTIYVIALITNPEIVTMTNQRLVTGLLMVAVIMSIAGYVIGYNHPAVLTCEDFEVSGNDVPTNCRE